VKDVSFAVEPGEVVGIIGRNGAGKSTLLKILSRVTTPSTGRVTLHGRMGSLLEVGTGFHHELTGRENIYMNGSILGMTRREIRSKFDEIVEFSGVEKFLDTPVKRYSSGMQVRLAFAVAAHLDPEILIIDEVLAVGDAAFQRRCLNKMGDVARSGRTILLVSHDMTAVQALCSRALVVHQGRIAHDGDAQSSVAEYMALSAQSINTPLNLRTDRRGTGKARLVEIELLDGNDRPAPTFAIGQELTLRLHLEHEHDDINLPRISLYFTSALGQRVLTVANLAAGWQERLTRPSSVVTCRIPQLPLVPGVYQVSAFIRDGKEPLDQIEPACVVELVPADVFGTGQCPNARDGTFYVQTEWNHNPARRSLTADNAAGAAIAAFAAGAGRSGAHEFRR
jgi:lipopolysaccharide transport system ATP-binding protein